MKTPLFHIALWLTLLFSSALYAQGVDDAINFTQTRYEGTARSMAMGGATGAMGGDLSAVCINPGSLGLYRGSEVSFSTGLQHVSTLSSYYGNSDSDYRLRLSIPNFGLVFGKEVSNYRPLRYIQFSIGLTRTNDFNYRSTASGVNPNSSMVDVYLQTANGIDDLLKPYINPDNYLADNFPYDLHPAWRTFLIDRFYNSEEDAYYFDSPVPAGNIKQEDIVTCKGRSEEWTFALAGNYFDKLFIGASFGLAHTKRISERNYSESGDFGNWTRHEDLADTAWGVNFKCGLVYYPASWLRVGAAWHSRTRSRIGEVWSTETSSSYYSGKFYSPTLNQSYEFRSPHSFTGSLAFIFPFAGMLTADVDYLDYSTSQFIGNDFNIANEDIQSLLKPSFNIRIGMEWAVRQFFVRGGIAYYGSPYGFGECYGSMKKAAIGIGYATMGRFIWDFAYELSRSVRGYTPYQLYVDGENIVEDVVQRQWRNKLVVTLRMKF